jgi:uncharacterized protein (DUF2267 family)
MLGRAEPRRRRSGADSDAAPVAADAAASGADADGAEAGAEPAATSASPHGALMDRASFVGRVRELGALADDHGAEVAIVATLGALSDALTPDEARRCAEHLPAEFAARLTGRAAPGPSSIDGIARALGGEANLGFAREHVEAVCAVVAAALDSETREVLVKHLGGDLGPIFQDRPPTTRPEPASRRRRHRQILAEGRPGSAHPLSEAAPAQGQSHSVAANPAPHAETKLSTSPGLTQERRDETLAAGKPDSERSIAAR